MRDLLSTLEFETAAVRDLLSMLGFETAATRDLLSMLGSETVGNLALQMMLDSCSARVRVLPTKKGAQTVAMLDFLSTLEFQTAAMRGLC